MSKPSLPKIFSQAADGSLSARLETERLIIRSIEAQDLKDLQELQGNETVMQFVGVGQARNPEKVEKIHSNLMSLWQKGNPIGGYIVCDKESRTFLGMACLEDVVDKDEKTVAGAAEVMLYFKPDFWGKKYGKEVGQAFLSCIAASQQEGVPMIAGGAPLTKLVATAEPRNAGSIALQKSLGFTQGETKTTIKGGKEVQRVNFEFDLTNFLSAVKAESSPSNAVQGQSAETVVEDQKGSRPI